MKKLTLTLLVLTLVALTTLSFAAMSVARKAFATDIVAREPVGPADTFPADVGKVYFHTQLLDVGIPTDIVHVWFYKGQEVAEVELRAEGKSWRTWSSKEILPHQKGSWTVEVHDVEGVVVDSAGFTIE